MHELTDGWGDVLQLSNNMPDLACEVQMWQASITMCSTACSQSCQVTPTVNVQKAYEPNSRLLRWLFRSWSRCRNMFRTLSAELALNHPAWGDSSSAPALSSMSSYHMGLITKSLIRTLHAPPDSTVSSTYTVDSVLLYYRLGTKESPAVYTASRPGCLMACINISQSVPHLAWPAQAS